MGFEPTVTCATLAFEASSFGRSDTLPRESLDHRGPWTEIRIPQAGAEGQRARKNSVRSAAQSAARTPSITSGRWLRRRSRTTSHRVGGSGLLVAGAVDHPVDAGLDGGARAHRARLQGDDQRAVGQPPAARTGGGPAQGEDLGVRRRVAVRLPLVVGGREQTAVRVEDDGAHRDVAAASRPLGLGEGLPHGGFPGGADGVGGGAGRTGRLRACALHTRNLPARPSGRPRGQRTASSTSEAPSTSAISPSASPGRRARSSPSPTPRSARSPPSPRGPAPAWPSGSPES